MSEIKEFKIINEWLGITDKKYHYNENIFCSQCDKLRYMGFTDKNDSELCTCLNQDEILTYKKSNESEESQNG